MQKIDVNCSLLFSRSNRLQNYTKVQNTIWVMRLKQWFDIWGNTIICRELDDDPQHSHICPLNIMLQPE